MTRAQQTRRDHARSPEATGQQRPNTVLAVVQATVMTALGCPGALLLLANVAP